MSVIFVPNLTGILRDSGVTLTDTSEINAVIRLKSDYGVFDVGVLAT